MPSRGPIYSRSLMCPIIRASRRPRPTKLKSMLRRVDAKIFRLVSSWRRQVPDHAGGKAVDIVRQSDAYQEVMKAVNGRGRNPGLGELEAAEWSPPAETGHPRWLLDVWFLRSYNGMTGEATAFQVDLHLGRVIGTRDFEFRPG